MPSGHLSFLVVEDHQFQRRCLTQLPTSLRATSVHCTDDGGIKLIGECEYPEHSVICDVTMPRAQRARRNDSPTPIAGLSHRHQASGFLESPT